MTKDQKQSQSQFASALTSSINQDKHYSNHLTTKPSNQSYTSGTVLALNLKSKLHFWILDSGATNHICNSLNLFIACKLISLISIRLPNGNQIIATIAGIVFFCDSLVLYNVLYLPSFSFNLVSVTKLASQLHCILKFTDKSYDIQDLTSLKRIGLAEAVDGLYVMNCPDSTLLPHPASTCMCTSIIDRWHFRLGHPFQNKLTLLKSAFPYISSSKCNDSCSICPLAKQRKLPYSLSNNKSECMFELIHIDIWGPLSVTSVYGHRYFLIVVDDFSRHTWLFMLKTKSEVSNYIISFVNLVETQFSCKIKSIKLDHNPEFNMYKFFDSKGILHQRSYVETPQQNGIVERKHQHILNVTQAIMFQSNLPKHFWNFTVSYVVFLINRLPSKLLQYKFLSTQFLHYKLP